MSKAKVIAIDGPAGSGKSTVAKLAADNLNFLYIDTGAMYRALTLKAIKKNIDLKNDRALVKLSQDTDIELKPEGSSLKVYLDSVDVTKDIRAMEVTRKVKFLASLKDVRENMVRLQRKLGSSV
ncbi:MAG: (d)CMP kinase, partial [Candidatus Omnitrophota bacterium]